MSLTTAAPPPPVPCTAADCNNQGTPSGNRPSCTCSCSIPFGGATCSACGPNRQTNYPTCTPTPCDGTNSGCNPSHTASISGNLVDGCQCNCGGVFGGPTCDDCEWGYAGYPSCSPIPCTNATDCSSHAIAVSGLEPAAYGGCNCTCGKYYQGPRCSQCAYGRQFPPTCSPIPCTILRDCNNRASNVTGTLISGCNCTCRPNYVGVQCESCASRVVMGLKIVLRPAARRWVCRTASMSSTPSASASDEDTGSRSLRLSLSHSLLITRSKSATSSRSRTLSTTASASSTRLLTSSTTIAPTTTASITATWPVSRSPSRSRSLASPTRTASYGSASVTEAPSATLSVSFSSTTSPTRSASLTPTDSASFSPSRSVTASIRTVSRTRTVTKSGTMSRGTFSMSFSPTIPFDCSIPEVRFEPPYVNLDTLEANGEGTVLTARIARHLWYRGVNDVFDALRLNSPTAELVTEAVAATSITPPMVLRNQSLFGTWTQFAEDEEILTVTPVYPASDLHVQLNTTDHLAPWMRFDALLASPKVTSSDSIDVRLQWTDSRPFPYVARQPPTAAVWSWWRSFDPSRFWASWVVAACEQEAAQGMDDEEVAACRRVGMVNTSVLHTGWRQGGGSYVAAEAWMQGRRGKPRFPPAYDPLVVWPDPLAQNATWMEELLLYQDASRAADVSRFLMNATNRRPSYLTLRLDLRAAGCVGVVGGVRSIYVNIQVFRPPQPLVDPLLSTLSSVVAALGSTQGGMRAQALMAMADHCRTGSSSAVDVDAEPQPSFPSAMIPGAPIGPAPSRYQRGAAVYNVALLLLVCGLWVAVAPSMLWLMRRRRCRALEKRIATFRQALDRCKDGLRIHDDAEVALQEEERESTVKLQRARLKSPWRRCVSSCHLPVQLLIPLHLTMTGTVVNATSSLFRGAEWYDWVLFVVIVFSVAAYLCLLYRGVQRAPLVFVPETASAAKREAIRMKSELWYRRWRWRMKCWLQGTGEWVAVPWASSADEAVEWKAAYGAVVAKLKYDRAATQTPTTDASTIPTSDSGTLPSTHRVPWIIGKFGQQFEFMDTVLTFATALFSAFDPLSVSVENQRAACLTSVLALIVVLTAFAVFVILSRPMIAPLRNGVLIAASVLNASTAVVLLAAELVDMIGIRVAAVGVAISASFISVFASTAAVLRLLLKLSEFIREQWTNKKQRDVSRKRRRSRVCNVLNQSGGAVNVPWRDLTVDDINMIGGDAAGEDDDDDDEDQDDNNSDGQIEEGTAMRLLPLGDSRIRDRHLRRRGIQLANQDEGVDHHDGLVVAGARGTDGRALLDETEESASSALFVDPGVGRFEARPTIVVEGEDDDDGLDRLLGPVTLPTLTDLILCDVIPPIPQNVGDGVNDFSALEMLLGDAEDEGAAEPPFGTAAGVPDAKRQRRTGS